MTVTLVQRRCLAFRVAVFLGILLCLFNAAGRFWPGVGVGVVGTLVAIVMARRTCRTARAAAEREQARHGQS